MDISQIKLDGADHLPQSSIDACKRAIASAGSKCGFIVDPLASRLKKMKKTIVTGARLIQDRLCPHGRNSGYRSAMFTLTYAKVEDWEPGHIRAFLTIVRNHLSRRGVKLRYAWTAELQKRGAVHYHCIIWLPRNLKLPMPDKCGWWPHGRTNSKFARKAVGYIAKYASKGLDDDTELPKGIRLYGLGGLLHEDRVELRYWRAPLFARIALGLGADIRKMTGGYYCHKSGGVVASPWVFCGFVGKRPFFLLFPT